MSNITLIDPQTAGISGDMFLAALVSAGADPKAIQRTLDLIPRYYLKCRALDLDIREVTRGGFKGTAIDLRISESKEEVLGNDFLQAAKTIAEHSSLSRKAADLAINCISDLVIVESQLHGVDPSKVHLHETGSADTLVDAFGSAAACDLLGMFDSRILAMPVAVGGGTISFSHGTMAAPPPAVLELARRKHIPIIGGPDDLELATPTGIAILANLTSAFVERYPPMVPEIVGYGAGRRELEKAPNLLRVVIGRSKTSELDSDAVVVLETNLDDIPGEVLGYAMQRTMDSGAKDVWVTSAQFKKNRPGHVLHVLCDRADSERLASIIMEETGTLGVRYQQWDRFILQRELRSLKVEIKGKVFDVRVKIARDKSGKIARLKPEFEDIRIVANALSMPTQVVSGIVLREAERFLEGTLS